MPILHFLRKHWSLLVTLRDVVFKGRFGERPTADHYADYRATLDEETKSEMQYALKHAMSIYPPFMLAMLRMTYYNKDTATSTMQLVKETFGLDGYDCILHCDPLLSQDFTFLNLFLYLRGRNDVYKPPFYLIRDDEEHRFVLSVRGSTTLTDWLTDFSAESASFDVQDDKGTNVKGKAHQGMLKSAEFIYRLVIHKLRAKFANKTYESYRLIITGHSLGAGVASLLGFMFLQTEQEKELNADILQRMKVYSFATPSVISPNLANLSLDLITSVILNTDVVSRIGIAPLDRCKEQLDARTKGADAQLKQLQDDKLLPAGRILWYLPVSKKERSSSLPDVLKSMFWDYDDEAKKGKYSEPEWELCDVTEHRSIFAEFIYDGYESIYAHLP
eukprot:CAMPEP_0202692174 /NCGR_PEP_ID=MMETSP1385-20130828/6622_1 /ASSEMBLY_ACC=CAM_ASM_000861 /TAXON_ID=933848 /ORGANISM="Elphidium margaritaceum" /LENGTH=388 /DNA_ID=CAMNT_0049347661 /DNA_START=90 /DNA_END=1252 /DNA_ORIENTATION=-